VVALDAGDGSSVWTADIDAAEIPEEAREWVLGESPGLPVQPAGVVGADGDTVVVASDDDAFFTAAMDAATGEVRWLDPAFRALAVGADSVAGATGDIDEQQLAGRAQADGAETWRAEASFEPDHVEDLGAGLAAAVGYVNTGGTHAEGQVTNMLSVDTGGVVATLDGEHTCVHDGDATVVCDSGERVVALDGASGDTLWELPDQAAGRIAPEIDAALSGAVYASTDDGAVVLDARTGEDEVTDLTVAPSDVVPGFALVFQEEERILAYPATR
jgi:outer membrane protein assembly factor BamB